MNKVTFKRLGQYAYTAYLDGERLGVIHASWRKVYGGDCWKVTVDGRDLYFDTRREAAAYLRGAARPTTPR